MKTLKNRRWLRPTNFLTPALLLGIAGSVTCGYAQITPLPQHVTNAPVSVLTNTPTEIPLTGLFLIVCSGTPGATTYAITNSLTFGTLSAIHSPTNPADPATVTYTPGNFLSLPGSDSFNWVRSQSNCADIIVTQPIIVTDVLPTNHQPTAQNLSLTVAANGSVRVPFSGVDADGDPLDVRLLSLPSHGSLSISSNAYFYNPLLNFIGTDSFDYAMNDGRTNSATAHVTISVKNGISVSSVAVVEGNTGRTNAIFVISLTVTPVEPVSVRFQTVDGTAKAGSDYIGTNGVVSFAAGTLVPRRLIIVPVLGDKVFELGETFTIQLSAPTNGILITSNGIGTILNDDLLIGTSEIAPATAAVRVGERIDYTLTWTHPERWRLLDTIDLMIVDDEGSIMNIRWKEPDNSFSLYNENSGRFTRAAAAGSPSRFETEAATLYLAQSGGGAPPGATVTIHYGLSFKPRAAGRTYSVEVFATDDFGNQQGFEPVGVLAVLPR